MRPFLAVVVGIAGSALAALILGEYELHGLLPYLACPLFAIAIAEIVATIAGKADTTLALLYAAMTAAGLMWAAWIQAGRTWVYVPTSTWIGIGLGVVVGVLWLRSAGTRVQRSRHDSAPQSDD